MSASSRQERAMLGFLANALIFSAAMAVYWHADYYADFLRDETKTTLLWLFTGYIIVGVPASLILPYDGDSKGLVALRAAREYMRKGWRQLRRFPPETYELPTMPSGEKTTVLFLCVKFFFLPIMFNFVFQNWEGLRGHWTGLASFDDIHDALLKGWYPFLVSLFFLIDTAYFAFGYTVESSFLRNTVRSVEPTFFGWVVALICYPPFNDIPGFYVGWTADDYASFDSLPLTYALRLGVLASLFVYVWATVALGAKSSNLTNRGIVRRGPYAYIRHPAYIAKNLAWWMTSLPFVVSTGRVWFAFASMGAWSLIYFLRALTEERHLGADPEYRDYCQKVRWRFIPYVL